MALWTVAVRLGPAVPAPHGPHADAVDYASAVARIYQRAGARRLVGQALARDFLTALTRRLRLRRGALPVDLLAAWRGANPGTAGTAAADQLADLLRDVGELRQGGLSDRELLARARAFDAFKAEVLRGR